MSVHAVKFTKVIPFQIRGKYSKDLESKFFGYLKGAVNSMRDDLSHCEPVSNAYNATVSALCDNVVQPLVSLLVLTWQKS